MSCYSDLGYSPIYEDFAGGDEAAVDDDQDRCLDLNVAFATLRPRQADAAKERGTAEDARGGVPIIEFTSGTESTPDADARPRMPRDAQPRRCRRGRNPAREGGPPILKFPQVPGLLIDLIDRPQEVPWGVGEPTAALVPAAISNAVFDAIGVRLR
jgi:hypothetical protein